MELLDTPNSNQDGLGTRSINNLVKTGNWTVLLGIVCLIIAVIGLLFIYALYRDSNRTYSYINDYQYLTDDFWIKIHQKRFRLFIFGLFFLGVGAALLFLTAIQAFRYYSFSQQLANNQSQEAAERCTSSIYKAIFYLGITSIVAIVGILAFIVLAVNHYV